MKLPKTNRPAKLKCKCGRKAQVLQIVPPRKAILWCGHCGLTTRLYRKDNENNVQ